MREGEKERERERERRQGLVGKRLSEGVREWEGEKESTSRTRLNWGNRKDCVGYFQNPASYLCPHGVMGGVLVV